MGDFPASRRDLRVAHPAILAGCGHAQLQAFTYFCLGGGTRYFAPATLDGLTDLGLIERVPGFNPPRFRVPDDVHAQWREFTKFANVVKD